MIGEDVAGGLSELYAEDFALGVACVDKLPGAITLVDRLCGGAVVAAVARVDRNPELRDEVRQILWQRLFVGTAAQAPRILSYAGRGPLAGWVAVAAQRIALDLRRDAARTVAADPGADQLLPSNDHPEADYLRARYRAEFETAVSEALIALPDRDRLLLRLTTVSGLSHEQIANIYKVNQSTVSRWIARARAEVLEATERVMCGKLGVPRASSVRSPACSSAGSTSASRASSPRRPNRGLARPLTIRHILREMSPLLDRVGVVLPGESRRAWSRRKLHRWSR